MAAVNQEKFFRDRNCLCLAGRFGQRIEASDVTSCPYQRAHMCGPSVKRLHNTARLELCTIADCVTVIYHVTLLVNF
jgi:hypothetical protein